MSFLHGRVLAVVALVLLSGLVACGGEGGSGGGSAGGSSPAAESGDDGAGDGGSGASGGATPTTAGESPAQGGGGDPGARFNLIASPDNAECGYVPGGHLSGADLLNVHFYFLIIGGNPPDVPAVSVVGSSNTGLQASYNSGPHNQNVSTAQFALRDGDFGRAHTITLTVDSSNRVPETDESDNRIRVSVELPSPRPTSTVDPMPCSVSRA